MELLLIALTAAGLIAGRPAHAVWRLVHQWARHRFGAP